MNLKRLLTFTGIIVLGSQLLHGQCSLITKNGSSQDPSSVCTPVNFTMNAWYKFLIPVDTSLVDILFEWNDGTGATTLVNGKWGGTEDSVYAEASHLYPPTDECSRTAQAYLIYDGEVCTSSGIQEQSFSTWGTDEENSGVLNIQPPVAYFCEGEPINNVVFDDNSTFNCNIFIEPDKPNRYHRWVQFVYNTYDQSGDRIPDITVDDGAGNIYNLTDSAGISNGQLYGPVIRIPIPADGPNQSSFSISAPPGGVAGDIFEITMRNWNVCNPYDNMPNDGNPPADTLNGDNDPIEITARIEIIAPPPIVTTTYNEYCANEDILLSVAPSSATVRWYKDPTLDTLIHTGRLYNPVLPPFNLDNSHAGSYSFYVTHTEGACESAPTTVDVVIFDNPSATFAGPDQLICSDSTTLQANNPAIGSGLWTTTSSAIIENDTLFNTKVRNLEAGTNTFRWTVTNGPCSAYDIVNIIRDVQPQPAFAGDDSTFCSGDTITLHGNVPTNSGHGHWYALEGTQEVADTTMAITQVWNLHHGNNHFIWRISSTNGACPLSIDTVVYFIDKHPGIANTANDVTVCDYSSVPVSADSLRNNGIGTWRVRMGSGIFADSTAAQTMVSNIDYGLNTFSWTVHSLYDICPVTADSMSITRDEMPVPANAGIDKSFCLITSDTLHGNVATAGMGRWNVITNPSGTPPSFSPNELAEDAVFSIIPGNEGRYTLEWEIINGSCETRDTVVIDFGLPPPPATAGEDTSLCGREFMLNGNITSQTTGRWTVISGPGTLQFIPGNTTPNSLIRINPGDEGIYELEWRLSSGSCPPTSDTIFIEFKPTPVNPGVTDEHMCGADTALLETSPSDTGDKIFWYSSLVSSVPFDTAVSIRRYLTGTTSYYVTEYNPVSGCESERIEIRAILSNVPELPASGDVVLCGPGAVSLSATSGLYGNTVNWYLNPYDTLPYLTGNSVNIPSVTTDLRLWISSIDTTSGCESEKDSVLITVYDSVGIPSVSPIEYCGPEEFTIKPLKGLNANQLRWYDQPVGGSLIAIADSFQTGVLTSSITYWVSGYNDSTMCESPRVAAPVTIYPVPGIPDISDTSRCGVGAMTLHGTPGTNGRVLRWYNAMNALTPVNEADTFDTPLLVGNTSYWVSSYNSSTGCESNRVELHIEVNPNPTNINILGPTLVLKDQTGVIYTTTGSSTSTYNWTIPPEIIVEQNMNDFLRLGFPNTGVYSISVQETTNKGCVGNPTSYPVRVQIDSIAVDIGLPYQNGCTGTEFQLNPYLFGGTPPYIYSWSGDTSYLTSTNTLFTVFNPPSTGTYRFCIDVVDVNLKTTRDSVIVRIYQSPVATINTPSQVVCVGESLQLDVTNSSTIIASHSWEGPVYELNSNIIEDPVFSPHNIDTFNFSYTVTDTVGCRDTDSVTFISDIPTADFNIDVLPDCSPLDVGFTNLSGNAVSYIWNLGDSTSSNTFEPQHTYINNSNELRYYKVILEAISPLGCSDYQTKYVTVWPTPEASITAIPEKICAPEEVLFIAPPGNSNYYWDYGDGTQEVSDEFGVRHYFSNTTETDLTMNIRLVTESSLHCYDTAYLALDVYASPEANFLVSPPADTFPDARFYLLNNTAGERWHYEWDFGDSRRSEVKDPGTIQYEAPGNYYVNLTASSEHCRDSISKLINVYPAPPVASFKSIDPGCMPHTINFINSSTYADSYLWEFGDGSISTAKEPTYTYYEPGIYKVKLTVTGEGGEASMTDTARVYILPNSFFDLAPRYVYVNDEPVNFFNLSDHADRFEWDFGDGETSEELNPKHVYKEEGTYDITLKVWTENECFDLYVMETAVYVEPSGKVEYPNAFRPMSPIEENREFSPGIIDHVDEYHLMIFNRWGELIFESFDQETGWDGYYKGQLAKQDVYIWKVKGSYTDGRGFEKSGDVTLLY
jgi:gliding motility-associated-like protein